jgi:hypothetical protein
MTEPSSAAGSLLARSSRMRPNRPPERWCLEGSFELAESHRSARHERASLIQNGRFVPRRAGKLLAVAYNRPPAWRYLPPTDPLPQPLQQVADAMVELGGWFKEEFWTGAGTDVVST